MSFKPTEEQLKAINSDGQILVSAAAGSGKTAVLVERVIRLLTREINPIRADKLLIITFTNAAANELKLRIDKKFQELIDKDKNNHFLIKQQMLLSSSSIGTIDSFCLNLIKENFEYLNISPDFKIIDNAEYTSLKSKVLKDIFKNKYEHNDVNFYNFLNLFPSDLDDLTAKNIIMDFFQVLSYQTFPEVFIENVKNLYSTNDYMAWLNSDNLIFSKTLTDSIEQLSKLKDEVDNNSNFYSLINIYFNYANDLLITLNNNKYEEIYNFLKDVNLPAPSSSTYKNKELQNKVRNYLSIIKDIVKKLLKIYKFDYKEINSNYIKIRNTVNLLIDLTLEFKDKLQELLIKKGLMTFDLAERLALSLLCKYEENKINILPNANEIVQRYDAVMVDEYQDTNNLQDFLFHLISNNGKNLFVVGDIKQSIYRFRGANPSNFLSKQTNYLDYIDNLQNKAQKIFLTKNFRSRKNICSFINYFFEKIALEESGSINYSDKEKLYPSAEFPENNETAADIVLINNTDDISNSELEAEYIAQYIIKTMQKEPFLKNNDDNLRKADYKDFAIFLRNDMGNIELFNRILSSYNIPVSTISKSPLISSEVTTIISLLKILDRKSDNISFVSALMSPLFGFNINEITALKTNYNDKFLLDSLYKEAKNGNIKSIKATEKINLFKNLASTLSIGELISKILDITNFRDIVLSMPNGNTRVNNLSILEELAYNFDDNQNNSLFAFLNFFEKISFEYNKDISINKNENSVNILTMHKSKGLQFPICIIAQNNKMFSKNDTRQVFLSNEKLGIGFKIFDENTGELLKTIPYDKIYQNNLKEQLNEELRVYYVALTRAEEKLVILVTNKGEFNLEKNNSTKINAFSSWIFNVLSNSKNEDFINHSFAVKNVNSFNILENKPIIENTENSNSINYDNVKKIKERFSFVYPYNELRDFSLKTSVSAIVSKGDKFNNSFSAKPSFVENEKLSAAEKGTALHKFMQFVDFNSAINNLQSEIERLIEFKFLSKDEGNSLNLKEVSAFLSSSLLKRILNSSEVKREYRFIYELPAHKVIKNLSNNLTDQKIIVQGAIDCLFIENNKIIIIDFKTDRLKEASNFIELYKEQLDLYSLACEKTFKLPVEEKYIYSLYLGKEIKL